MKTNAEPVPVGELTARLDDAPLIMSVTETFPLTGELRQVAQALTGQQITDHAGCPVKETG